jgi:uracil phosphoribosyltransferase
MSKHLTIIDHPLVQHKLSLMRRKETPSATFRQLLWETSMLLAYEVTRDLPLTTISLDTPLCRMQAPVIDGKKLALVSILRAGMVCSMDSSRSSLRLGSVSWVFTGTKKRFNRWSIT